MSIIDSLLMIEPGQIITSNYSQWMEILKQRNTLHSLLDVIWLQTKPIILQDLPRRNLLTPIIWQNLMRSIHEIFILCPNQTWDLLTTSIVQNKFPLTSKAEKVFFPLSLLQLRRQMLVGIFLHYRPFWCPKRACLSWIQNLSVEPSSIFIFITKINISKAHVSAHAKSP